MDGNKDEALKCLKIAEAAMRSGDKNRAMKFLNKARRLDPSIQFDDLLAKIDGLDSDNESCNEPTNEIPVNSGKPTENGPRRRVSASGSSSSSTASVAYSEEQVTIVREIKRKKDYYEILRLEKNCTVEDVRKAYRKLSLKVHPDKNKAPGAEEAFKMVSKAFQCLSDEESRKRYDLVGSDEPVAERRSRRGAGGMQGFNGFYGEDVDAEEIFRNFFFGGMHPAATTQFNGFGFGPGMGARMGGDRGSHGLNKMVLIQLLPVLLLLLLNFLPSSQPIYSLSRSYPYQRQFTTQKGVNYFVKSGDFEQKYPSNSPEHVALEEQVENDYYSILAHNCRVEVQQLHWGYRRETPNCDALKRFESVG